MAIAPMNVIGKLDIRPITTAANDPTRSSVNWNSWQAQDGPEEHTREAGEHDADHPRTGRDSFRVHARDLRVRG